MGKRRLQKGNWPRDRPEITSRCISITRVGSSSSPPPASRERAHALSLSLSVCPSVCLSSAYPRPGGFPFEGRLSSTIAISSCDLSDPLRPPSSPHGTGLSSFVSQYTSLLISPGTNYAIISRCIGAEVDIEFINSLRRPHVRFAHLPFPSPSISTLEIVARSNPNGPAY